MTNKPDYNYLKYYPRQWLQRWLAQLRTLRGSLTFLHTKAGLNARYTNICPPPDPVKYTMDKYLRVLCGLMDSMEEDEFVDFASDRFRELYKFYEEYGIEFLKLYKRKKK